MSNFPAAFEQRMKASLPNDWENFSAVHGSDVPVSIRVNPAKSELPVSDLVPWTAFGKYLEKRPVFTLDPAFHAGAYYVQEASSMFLEHVLLQAVDIRQPLRVLDLCAAPGGKSTHLLSLLASGSLLVANEVIRARASILSENIQKWGYTNVVVTNNDPSDFQRLGGYFDVIVVDAPCSGEGLFRKDPHAMNEWSTDHVTLCSQRQKRILDDVWPALKENGILLYCTCTYNDQENENNLKWLRQNKMSESIKIAISPDWGIEEVTNDHCTGYRFYPHRVRGEGFFISAQRKAGEERTTRISSKQLFQKLPVKTTERLIPWINNASQYHFVLQDDLIIMMCAEYLSDIEFISKELHVVTKGTAVASLKHDKLIPEHALAMSNALIKENFMGLELDESHALSYLRKDHIDVPDQRKGFALVTCKGLPLGWVNLLGNRMNNLYPSSWRIRMGS
jgi:16S rRNA C967 or C1407 C5-methylase (RsmB/RsmF family)/NOL1/NOP2/fmu family ribosome biogenesis protein